MGTFYSEAQHQDKLKGQQLSSKMINEQSLINLIKDMPYKHFTLEQRNELSALLRAKVRKKKIASILRKDRTTVWRGRKKNKSQRQV